MKKEKQDGEKVKLLPSHYYMDGTRLVFTEQYHIDRGYCCGNGCKHCCFFPKHTKGCTFVETEYNEMKNKM